MSKSPEEEYPVKALGWAVRDQSWPSFSLPTSLQGLHVKKMRGSRCYTGSGVGGMKETQEMIHFAAKQNITTDIEVISTDYLKTAMECLAKKMMLGTDLSSTLQIRWQLRSRKLMSSECGFSVLDRSF